MLSILIPSIARAKKSEIALPQEATKQEAPKVKSFLFLGKINSDKINVRSDSTVTSKVICVAEKGERVQIVKEAYEWYKIRLPKTAPSFIKKDFVEVIDGKTAKVTKDNVNVRFAPNEQSAVLGRAGKNEIINVIGESGEWYEIAPVISSYGWINKKFVDKVEPSEVKEETRLSVEVKKETKSAKKEIVPVNEEITVEGVIKPYGKVIKRTASHKLTTKDNTTFLLKGDKENLDSLNYRKVKITGKSIQPKGQKLITIEIEKIEALD